jgi:alanyl-tRNA synthetase
LAEIDAEELRRKVPDGVTQARLVSVEGFDVIPCCGTHVRSTGELGLVKVLRWEKVKGTQRVHFKVGRRALADFELKHGVVQELAARFTTGTTEILARVDKLMAENQSAKKTLRALSQRLAELERKVLLAGAETIGAVRLVARVVDGDGGYARALSNALRSGANTIAILAATDGTVVCAASDGLAVDVAASALARAAQAGGSGGGKGGFAQVKLPAGADVQDFINQVGDDVRSTL